MLGTLTAWSLDPVSPSLPPSLSQGEVLPPHKPAQKTPGLPWTDLCNHSFSRPRNFWLSLVLIPNPAHLALQECQDRPDKLRGIRRSLTLPSLCSAAQRLFPSKGIPTPG